MQWKDHSKRVKDGDHAFLGASTYAWLNYSDEKLIESYRASIARAKGTAYHALAANLIKMGVKLPASRKTLNMYVNDAIGFKMRPEQKLYYSEFAYGTADAICFRKNTLRVHDLKTGRLKPSFHQLEIYVALFFLDYPEYKPGNVKVELRLYYDDDILVANPETDIIVPIMDKIIHMDKLLKRLKEEESDGL